VTTVALPVQGRFVRHSGYLTTRAVRALIAALVPGGKLVQPVVWLLCSGSCSVDRRHPGVLGRRHYLESYPGP